MNKKHNENKEKLNMLIDTLCKLKKNKGNTNTFPTIYKLKKKDTHISIIIEQANKILDDDINKKMFGLDIDSDDVISLVERFISDILQFATKNKIELNDPVIAYYSQSKISEGAFYHLATSSILPKTYKSIEQHAGHVFDTYSIPFKIRVCIENKIKSIIGFESIEVTKDKDIYESYDLPFSYILKELIYTKCLKLPCSLHDIKNIYKWSCNFCHTGEKEPIWLILKALDITSTLFTFEHQKEYQVKILKILNKEKAPINEVIDIYNDHFNNCLYYFNSGWSIKRLQNHLNTPKDKTRKYTIKDATNVKFNLSEKKLNEPFLYYCSKNKKNY